MGDAATIDFWQRPIYPITRLQKGISGETTIEFTIAEDGTTKDFIVVESDY